MDSVGVVVLHADPTVARAVGEAIEGAADLFVAGIRASAIGTGAVVVAGGEALLGLEPPEAPVVALADGDALRAARAALSLGARDLLRWPEEAERLPDAIRTAARPDDLRAASSPVVAVVGARGGLGASTIAAVLATRLANPVVLDLDPVSAGQRAFAREEPRRTLSDLLADPSPGALEAALVDHPGGARALHAGPGSAPEPGPARVLVRAARTLGPVVVDCGRGASAAQQAALEVADVRLLVAGDDVASVRGARALVERRPGGWTLVVRRMRRAGVPVRQAAAALDLEVAAIVPRDAALARATDLGRLPMRPTRAVRAIRRLATVVERG